MLSTQGSLARGIDLPTLGRHALIVGILSLGCALWIGAMNRIDEPLVTSDYAPIISVGEVDVPAYYFPAEADTTERYVAARETDCGRTGSTVPHDYPVGWLKP
jgi:hypothetical protein